MLYYVLGIVLGYLFGLFNTAMFIGKRKGIKDIRTMGSKNAGASNVTMVLGWKYGIITGVTDILKGVIPVLIIRLLVNDDQLLWAITGLAVIIGHNYPIHLKLKGGKGTAAFFGIMLSIDYRIALILGAVIIITTIATDFIAIGTILTMIVSPILLYVLNYDLYLVLILLFISLLSIYKHLPNIRNIINKTEGGLSKTFEKNKE